MRNKILFVALIALAGSALAQSPTDRLTGAYGPAGTPTPRGNGCTIGTATGVETVADGGFEGGTPNAAWNEFSTNFGTPLCDAGSCGTGGGTGPNSGAWWNWMGGIGNTFEESTVDQSVTIPNGTAELSFWLEVPVCADSSTGEFMEVNIDGTTVFSYDCSQGTLTPYTQQTVDVSAFADGGSHTLEITGQTQASTGGSNFFVDDVSLCAVEQAAPPPESVPIPTLGVAGIAILSLLILGLGGVLVRRMI